jgi:hypothetical protein
MCGGTSIFLNNCIHTFCYYMVHDTNPNPWSSGLGHIFFWRQHCLSVSIMFCTFWFPLILIWLWHVHGCSTRHTESHWIYSKPHYYNNFFINIASQQSIPFTLIIDFFISVPLSLCLSFWNLTNTIHPVIYEKMPSLPLNERLLIWPFEQIISVIGKNLLLDTPIQENRSLLKWPLFPTSNLSSNIT